MPALIFVPLAWQSPPTVELAVKRVLPGLVPVARATLQFVAVHSVLSVRVPKNHEYHGRSDCALGRLPTLLPGRHTAEAADALSPDPPAPDVQTAA